MHRKLLALLGLILAVVFAAGAQEQSVAEAARKAREKKQQQAKATKVITNDNIPTSGGISVLGSTPVETKEGTKAGAKDGEKADADKEPTKDEQYWRNRFGELRKKLAQSEKELDILQRELKLNEVQYYSDPNVALREQTQRSEINEQRKKIEDKQAEIRDLRQQVSDLEDELRREGGNPAWGRP